MEPTTRSIRNRFTPPDLTQPVNEIDLWLALVQVMGSPLGLEASRLAGDTGCVLLPLCTLPPVNLLAACKHLAPRFVAVRQDLIGRWCLAVSTNPIKIDGLHYMPVRMTGNDDDGGLWVGYPLREI